MNTTQPTPVLDEKLPDKKPPSRTRRGRGSRGITLRTAVRRALVAVVVAATTTITAAGAWLVHWFASRSGAPVSAAPAPASREPGIEPFVLASRRLDHDRLVQPRLRDVLPGLQADWRRIAAAATDEEERVLHEPVMAIHWAVAADDCVRLDEAIRSANRTIDGLNDLRARQWSRTASSDRGSPERAQREAAAAPPAVLPRFMNQDLVRAAPHVAPAPDVLPPEAEPPAVAANPPEPSVDDAAGDPEPELVLRPVEGGGELVLRGVAGLALLHAEVTEAPEIHASILSAEVDGAITFFLEDGLLGALRDVRLTLARFDSAEGVLTAGLDELATTPSPTLSWEPLRPEPVEPEPEPQPPRGKASSGR